MLAYISIIFMGVDSSLFPQKSFTDMLMNMICAVSEMKWEEEKKPNALI